MDTPTYLTFTVRVRVTPDSTWPNGTPNLIATVNREGGIDTLQQIVAQLLGHIGLEVDKVYR